MPRVSWLFRISLNCCDPCNRGTRMNSGWAGRAPAHGLQHASRFTWQILIVLGVEATPTAHERSIRRLLSQPPSICSRGQRMNARAHQKHALNGHWAGAARADCLSLDDFGHILVHVFGVAVAVHAHQNLLVSLSERLQVLVVSCNADLDLKAKASGGQYKPGGRQGRWARPSAPQCRPSAA